MSRIHTSIIIKLLLVFRVSRADDASTSQTNNDTDNTVKLPPEDMSALTFDEWKLKEQEKSKNVEGCFAVYFVVKIVQTKCFDIRSVVVVLLSKVLIYF